MDWVRIIENNAVLIIALAVFYLVSRKKNVKKFEMGPLKVEHQTDADKYEVIDPRDNCPYDKAYTAGREATRKVDAKCEALEKTVGQELKALNEKIDRDLGEKRKARIDVLKLILNSKSSPPEDRVLAALECVYLGENGWTKKDAVGISRKFPDTYRAICRARPDLRLPEVENYLETEGG